MPQPLVLAIEPDLRQAAIVKRIVREKVLADVAVVDSRDAALEAMRTTIPDVLLLSALMSPRDEDELIAHLRTLENADHLQTHTIPQLASTLNPTESSGPRGLLSAFRRKKKEPEVAPSGCDPDLFAEEIRVFLERAADKKRERAAAAANAGATPADTAWRAGSPQKAAGPVTTVDAAPETEAASSSWSSPFEWKPSTVSTPMADPEISTAPTDAAHASAESLMAHLRPPAGIPSVSDLSLSSQTEEPEFAASPIDTPQIDVPYIEEPPIEVAPIEVAPIEMAVEMPPIEVAVAEPPPVVAAAPIVVETAPVVEERVARREERAAKTEDRGSKIKDAGLRIRDQRSAMKEQRLGALASWARSEDRARDAAQGSDDLRALLTSLAVPPAVVSVGYGRGCRIRRVRVLAARERRESEAVGAVIISRRVLAEQRGLRDQQQA